jgi:hypothetical protein
LKQTYKQNQLILLDPKNIPTCDNNSQYWAIKRFYLEEPVPEEFRVLIKEDNRPVLVIENMYEVLCWIYAEIDQHRR